MKRSTVSTTELALDAAADLILENPPSAPATPSISNLCKAVGIGASTFYRLYQNSDEFRHALAVYSILDSYEPGRQAVAEALETTTLETTAPEPATIAPEPSAAGPVATPSSEADRAALLTILSQAFQDSDVRSEALEAAYLPWLHVPEIAEALRQSFYLASSDYEQIAISVLAQLGQRAIETASPDDIMRRILTTVLATDLVSTEFTWRTAANEMVTTVVYTHVNLVEFLSEPVN